MALARTACAAGGRDYRQYTGHVPIKRPIRSRAAKGRALDFPYVGRSVSYACLAVPYPMHPWVTVKVRGATNGPCSDRYSIRWNPATSFSRKENQVACLNNNLTNEYVSKKTYPSGTRREYILIRPGGGLPAAGGPGMPCLLTLFRLRILPFQRDARMPYPRILVFLPRSFSVTS